jgi:hypothetical protein
MAFSLKGVRYSTAGSEPWLEWTVGLARDHREWSGGRCCDLQGRKRISVRLWEGPAPEPYTASPACGEPYLADCDSGTSTSHEHLALNTTGL